MSLGFSPEGEDGAASADAQKFVEDLAKHHKDQYSAMVGRAATGLYAWSAALILLLVQPLMPLAMSINDSEKYFARWRRPAVVRPERGPSASDEERERDDKAVRLIEALKKVQKVATPVGTIELPATLILPIYSALMAFFVLSLLQRRILLSTTALKVVQLRREFLGHPGERIRELGAWTPFWLAPLPRVEVHSQRFGAAADIRRDLLRFFGWRSQRFRAVLVIISLGVLFSIWGWTVNLARRLDQLLLDLPAYGFFEQKPDRLQALAELLDQRRYSNSLLWSWQTHGLLLVCGAVVCFFFIYPKVEWGAFPEALTARSRARRMFLGLTFGAVAAYAMSSILPARIARRLPWQRNPRYRRRRSGTPDSLTPSTFLVNHNSNVVHYVTPSGFTLGKVDVIGMTVQPETVPRLRLEIGPRKKEPDAKAVASGRAAEEEFQRQQVLIARLNRRFASLSMEIVAVSLAKQDKIREAIRILTLEVLQRATPPQPRLFDLLAGLLHRAHADAVERQQFAAMALTIAPDNPIVVAAVRRLQNPPHAWSEHWQAPAFPWRMPWEGRPPRHRYWKRFSRWVSNWGRSSNVKKRKQ